jgi:hypothetical protein
MKLSQTNFFVRSKYRAEAGTNLRFAAQIRSVPLAGQWKRVLELPIGLADRYFHPLTTGYFWQPDCEYEGDLQIVQE